MESPGRQQRIATAASIIGAPTVKELRKLPQKRGPSHLEEKFLRLWMDANGPTLEREVTFAKPRRWRFDFAHMASRTAIEVEGGAFGGRHVRPTGFLGDAEKYLAAFLAGWRVVRLTSPQLTPETIAAIIGRIRPQARNGAEMEEQPS